MPHPNYPVNSPDHVGRLVFTASSQVGDAIHATFSPRDVVSRTVNQEFEFRTSPVALPKPLEERTDRPTFLRAWNPKLPASWSQKKAVLRIAASMNVEIIDPESKNVPLNELYYTQSIGRSGIRLVAYPLGHAANDLLTNLSLEDDSLLYTTLTPDQLHPEITTVKDLLLKQAALAKELEQIRIMNLKLTGPTAVEGLLNE